jgi:hypothetical protein
MSDDLPSGLESTGMRVPLGAAEAKVEKQSRTVRGVVTSSNRSCAAMKSGDADGADGADGLAPADARLDLSSAAVGATEAGGRWTAGFTK